MNGNVIPGTPIAVDFWQPTKAREARLFFLTHLHMDHVQGLTSSWRLPIYTSPTNAALLQHMFKLPRSLIHELEVDQSYLLPLDEAGDVTISVTPLDANHVPGAVMFLFQGYFGSILYSGDMRWYPELACHPALAGLVGAEGLDVLYLDNTFSAPYCKFPSREDAKRQLFDIIDNYPDHTIKLTVRNLGREELLEAVATRYQERVCVSEAKYRLLELLQYPDIFTMDPAETRFHTVSMAEMRVKKHFEWNQQQPTISVMLTALYEGWPNGPYSSQERNGIFRVPYSDHSSYDELMEMVAALKPRKIIPIVTRFTKYGWWADPMAPDQTVKKDMSLYQHLLSRPPPPVFLIPEGVRKVMIPGGPWMNLHNPRKCGVRRGPPPRPRRTIGAAKGIQFSPEQPTSPVPSSSLTLDVSITTDPTVPTPQPDILPPLTNPQEEQNTQRYTIHHRIPTTPSLKPGHMSTSHPTPAPDVAYPKRKLIFSEGLAKSQQTSVVERMKNTKYLLDSCNETLHTGSMKNIIAQTKALCKSVSVLEQSL